MRCQFIIELRRVTSVDVVLKHFRLMSTAFPRWQVNSVGSYNSTTMLSKCLRFIVAACKCNQLAIDKSEDRWEGKDYRESGKQSREVRLLRSVLKARVFQTRVASWTRGRKVEITVPGFPRFSGTIAPTLGQAHGFPGRSRRAEFFTETGRTLVYVKQDLVADIWAVYRGKY